MKKDGILAGLLRTGQKFITRITKRRGIVEDIRQVVEDHGTDGQPVFTSAPRVMLVGGPTGVTHKTLHPDVVVDLP